MLPPLTLNLTQKLAFLSQCPAFRDCSRESLLPLADAMETESLLHETVLDPYVHSPSQRPFRVVYGGSLAIDLAEDRLLAQVGHLAGLSGVVSYAAPQLDEQQATGLVYTMEPTVALVLPPSRFGAAFGLPVAAPALRAVLAESLRQSSLSAAVDSLRRFAPFSSATRPQLKHMLTYARTRRLARGEVHPWLHKGATPQGLVLLQEGTFASDHDDRADPRRVWPSGEVPGLSRLIDQLPLDSDLYALTDARCLELSVEDLLSAARRVPHLLRALLTESKRLPLFTNPAEPFYAGSLVAVFPCVRSGLPVRNIALASATVCADRYGDRVLYLSLLPAGSPEPPPTGKKGRVVRAWLPLDQLNQSQVTEWVREQYDTVVLDTTPLGREAAFDATVQDTLLALAAPLRSALLFDQLSEWLCYFVECPPKLRASVLPSVLLHGERLDPLSLEAEQLQQELKAQQGASGPLEAARSVADSAYRLARGTLQSWHEAVESAGTGVPPWPLGAARVMLPDGALALLRTTDDVTTFAVLPPVQRVVTEESLARWGRAWTGRRVGVALGGAGALSYAGVAVLEGLVSSGLPIDAVSGTSFGAVVGAFWALEGRAGLERLLRLWPQVSLLMTTTSCSTAGMEVWIDLTLGLTELTQLPVPLIPVGSNAATMTEWDVRSGSVGAGVRISGSLPPFAPTMRGRLRLLDGGLTADVPSRILREEGCDLVIAVMPFCAPPPEPAMPVWIPVLSHCFQTGNPYYRFSDYFRGYQSIWRLSSFAQQRFADVSWNAPAAQGMPTAFWHGEYIVQRTRQSASLQQTLARARRAWAQLVPRAALAPEGRAYLSFEQRLDPETGVTEALTPESQELLVGLSHALTSVQGGTLTVHCQVSDASSQKENLARAMLRGGLVRAELERLGVLEHFTVHLDGASGDRTQGDLAWIEARGVTP